MDAQLQDVPPSSTSNNATGIIVNEETRIETVIIILWVTGGVLLIALLIMLFCLLKSKRKGGRSIHRRPSLFHIDARGGYPRGGGVNHGYTSYDEIWTWIPVVRGNQDQCPNTRLTRTPSTASTLHREPPPYSVATAGRGGPTSAPSIVNSHSSGNPVSTVITSSDTLALATPILTGRGRNSVSTSAANNVMTSSFENRSLRSIDNSNNGVDQRLSTQIQGSTQARKTVVDVRSPHASRRHNRHADHLSHSHPISHHSNAQLNDITNLRGNGNNRESEHAQIVRPFEYHPEEGVYSYITGVDGRRAWCDIPPTLLDEDGPPPYAPPPDYPGYRRYQQNSGQSNNRSAPLMRLDYDYF